VNDWIDFDQWKNCAQMERPGFIFEVRNEAGESLFTPCTHPLRMPPDWTSAPVHFRLVQEPKPRHSTPAPKPRQRP